MNQVSPMGDMVDGVQLEHHGVAKSHVVAYIDEGDQGGGRESLQLAQGLMNLQSPFERVRAVLAQVAEIQEGKGRR